MIDRLTGDPGRVVGQQERDRARHVRRFAEPARADSRQQPAASRPSYSARAKAVLITAGATALTRTSGASSSASCMVRFMIAAFETP